MFETWAIGYATLFIISLYIGVFLPGTNVTLSTTIIFFYLYIGVFLPGTTMTL